MASLYGLSPCLQLARAGTVGRPGAKLLLEVSERVRTLTQAYFSPERPLHLSFTHLVCRSAIEGNLQGTALRLPSLGPHLHCTKSPTGFTGSREHLCLFVTLGATGIWVG